MKKIIPFLLITLLFVSCDTTYEFKTEEEKAFVGSWVNPYASILISPEGKFAYKLEKPGKKVTMNSNIKRFEEGKLIINMFVTESEFTLDSKPTLNSEGNWEMTVDGRRYIKVNY